MIKAPRKRQKKRVKVADHRYMGDEPVFTIPITDENDPFLTKTYNWYTHYHNIDKDKIDALRYIKSNFPELYPTIKTAPNHRFSSTFCITAKLLNEGWVIPGGIIERLHERIREIYSVTYAPVEEKKIPQKKEIDKNRQYYNMIDDEIDDFTWNGKKDFSLYNWLVANNIQAASAKAINQYCQGFMDDLLNKEGYENLPVKKYKEWVAWYQALLDDSERYSQNKKTTRITRKPRTKKEIPVEKLIEQLQYMKEYIPLKLVSIDPKQIIKATQVWIYDTKHRTLSMINSLEGGFSVKGTTINNIDENTSKSKRLRKPEEKLSELLSAGKVALRSFIDSIKTTDIRTTGRMNSDKIIVRVLK